MPDNRKVARVFLASPGDLGEERKIAKSTTDRWNVKWADFLGLQLELVGWEDTVSVYGRPQAVINQDLSRCELFVGMLWQEWGSPTGEYSSGFEEEFRISEASRTEVGRPEISLLFKELEASRKKDPGDVLKKVLSFQAEVGPKILYQYFSGAEDFQEKFDAILTKYAQQLVGRERAIDLARNELASPEPQKIRNDGPLKAAASDFVRAFAASAVEDGAELDRVDLARFRLIGAALHASGNDEASLGPRDANIIFQSRHDLHLTEQELEALVDSGLARFRSQNAPLWFWLATDHIAGINHFLLASTTFGPTNRRANALKVMLLLGQAITSPTPIPRERFARIWLANDTPEDVKEAALKYLQAHGTADDLPVIKEEIDRGSYRTTKLAIAAYISILWREDAGQATLALVDLQVESISDDLVNLVFSSASSIADEVLSRLLAHRSPAVRVAAANELRKRNALSRGTAEQLCEDDDPKVRLAGLAARHALGEVFSDGAVRSVLVRRRRVAGLFAGSSLAGEDGEEEVEQFRFHMLRTRSRSELQRELDSEPFLSEEIQIELWRRSFAANGDSLRAQIRDGFVAWFARLISLLDAQSEARARLQRQEIGLRSRWMRLSLDVILEKGGPRDLALLRFALGGDLADVTDRDVQFFGRHGEWQDVRILVEHYEKRATARPLGFFSTPDVKSLEFVAAALCRIARGNIARLFAMDMRASCASRC